jgi:hypothetical protein
MQAIKFVITFAFLLTIQATCNAKDYISEIFSERPIGHIKASTLPYYKNPIYAIKNVISAEKMNKKINHFCVVAYEWPNRPATAWVHWKEENLVILWGGSVYRDTRDNGLIQSRRSLKLGRDTVATENDLGGSTYLETNAWWHAVVDDCAAHGEKFTVLPFKATKPYVGAE